MKFNIYIVSIVLLLIIIIYLMFFFYRNRITIKQTTFEDRIDVLNPLYIDDIIPTLGPTIIPTHAPTHVPTFTTGVTPTSNPINQQVNESFQNITSKKDEIKNIFKLPTSTDDEKMEFKKQFNSKVKEIFNFMVDKNLKNKILKDITSYNNVTRCSPTPGNLCNTALNIKHIENDFQPGINDSEKINLIFNDNTGIDQSLKLEYNIVGFETIKEHILQKSDNIICGSNINFFKTISEESNVNIKDLNSSEYADDSDADLKIKTLIVLDALIEILKTKGRDSSEAKFVLRVKKNSNNIVDKYSLRKVGTEILTDDVVNKYDINKVIDLNQILDESNLNESKDSFDELSSVAKILSDARQPNKTICLE